MRLAAGLGRVGARRRAPWLERTRGAFGPLLLAVLGATASCSLNLAFLEDGNPAADAGEDVMQTDPGEGGGGSTAGSVDAGPSSNLIVNPGFEDGTTGWYVWQGMVVASSAHAHTGMYGGCLVGPSQDPRGPVQDITAVDQPSASYTFSAWAWWGIAAGDGGTAGDGDGSGAASSDSDGAESGAPSGGGGSDDGGPDAELEAATAWESTKVLTVTVCPDGTTHYSACVDDILVPEGAWTQLTGVCEGFADPCGEAGALDIELYFQTADPEIGLCVDDVSLTAE